jgi:hypothetical protein
MAKQITGRGEKLDDYLVSYGTRETPLMRRMRADTQKVTAGACRLAPTRARCRAFLSSSPIRRALNLTDRDLLAKMPATNYAQ